MPTQDPLSFQGKLFVIASPNPPYGNSIPREWIKSFLESFEGLVVIDEAYVDFAPDNWIKDAIKYSNVVVTRSYSKSFSLAGIRFGYGVANPLLMKEMYKIKDSYNVNAFTQIAALTALKYQEVIQKNIKNIIESRRYVSEALLSMGWRVYPSDANFVFAEKEDAKDVHEYLMEHDIYVRYFSTPRLANGLRITIGRPEECDILLSRLKDFENER